MNKLTIAVFSACLLGSGAAFAQDAMTKDAMAGDSMAKDHMAKDSMKKDGMAKRSISEDMQQVQVVGQPLPNQRAPYGYASTGTPERAVDLSNGKKYLNVTRLETIQIKKDDNNVTWTFDTLGTPSFSLDKVVPWASGVTVYVEESPLYRGG